MYTEKDRKDFLQRILNKVKESPNILGTFLIGSCSIGFNDIYSDIDLMMAYNENTSAEIVKNEILNFFEKEKIGYIMERKWTEKIWGISIYMKNGLSTDISFGPLNELKVKSPQITIAVDKNGKLEKHLQTELNNFASKYSNYKIDEKINWEFMYCIRKYLIAIKRKDFIYAYYMLNDARMIVMKLQGLNEGKKLHEFKAYGQLDNTFLKEIEKTLPKNIKKEELDACKEKIIELFLKTINNNPNIEFDSKSKYLLEIAD